MAPVLLGTSVLLHCSVLRIPIREPNSDGCSRRRQLEFNHGVQQLLQSWPRMRFRV